MPNNPLDDKSLLQEARKALRERIALFDWTKDSKVFAAQLTRILDALDSLEKDNTELRSSLSEAERALEFYANYTSGESVGLWHSAMGDDAGEIARAVLSSLRSDGNRHKGCGRGDLENGPDDGDCLCRLTNKKQECAEAGCGFCLAELGEGQK